MDERWILHSHAEWNGVVRSPQGQLLSDFQKVRVQYRPKRSGQDETRSIFFLEPASPRPTLLLYSAYSARLSAADQRECALDPTGSACRPAYLSALRDRLPVRAIQSFVSFHLISPAVPHLYRLSTSSISSSSIFPCKA